MGRVQNNEILNVEHKNYKLLEIPNTEMINYGLLQRYI